MSHPVPEISPIWFYLHFVGLLVRKCLEQNTWHTSQAVYVTWPLTVSFLALTFDIPSRICSCSVVLGSSTTRRFPHIHFLQLKPAALTRKEHGDDLERSVTSRVRMMMSEVNRMQTPSY